MGSSKKHYTEEQVQWLKKHAGTIPYHDLVVLFNETFGENKKYDALRSFCLRYLGTYVGSNAFTQIKHIDELIAIYKEHIDLPIADIARMYNEKFGTNYKPSSLEHIVYKNGIKKTDMGHRQGNTHNETPLYSIKNNSAGFELIKVKEGTKSKNYRDGWITLANFKWEQYNGEKLKENEFVLFVNNDNRDYRPENLVKVTKGEYLYLCQNHMIGQGECLLASLDIIRAKNLIKELKEL